MILADLSSPRRGSTSTGAACTSITPPSTLPEKERPVNLEQLKQSLGRGFDKEENRPTNLQIPLARK